VTTCWAVTSGWTVAGLPVGRHTVSHWRVDDGHSNVFGAWRSMGGGERDWPTDQEWDLLRDCDGLDELEPERAVDVGADGLLELSFRLPQPGISYLEVTPADPLPPPLD